MLRGMTPTTGPVVAGGLEKESGDPRQPNVEATEAAKENVGTTPHYWRRSMSTSGNTGMQGSGVRGGGASGRREGLQRT